MFRAGVTLGIYYSYYYYSILYTYIYYYIPVSFPLLFYSPTLLSSSMFMFPYPLLRFNPYLPSFPKLTPHVLSEWMVEVCAGDKYVFSF